MYSEHVCMYVYGCLQWREEDGMYSVRVCSVCACMHAVRRETGRQRKRRMVRIVCVCVVYVRVCVHRGEQLFRRGRGGWYVYCACV